MRAASAWATASCSSPTAAPARRSRARVWAAAVGRWWGRSARLTSASSARASPATPPAIICPPPLTACGPRSDRRPGYVRGPAKIVVEIRRRDPLQVLHCRTLGPPDAGTESALLRRQVFVAHELEPDPSFFTRPSAGGVERKREPASCLAWYLRAQVEQSQGTASGQVAQCQKPPSGARLWQEGHSRSASASPPRAPSTRANLWRTSCQPVAFRFIPRAWDMGGAGGDL